MRISYTDWWDDVVAIARANASILIAVAGAFVFLPALVSSFVTVPMTPLAQGAAPAEMIAAYTRHLRDNWLPQLALVLLGTLGQLLLYIVLLDARRPRVGDAFGMAPTLFVPFLATSILASLIVGAGSLLLIVPGLYLIGRVMLAAAALVAERRSSPLAAIARSFALTHGRGWRIFFFVFLVFLVAIVIQLAIGGTLGVVLGLLADDSGRLSPGRLLLAGLEAMFAAIYSLLAVVLWVALYRRLAGPAAPAG